MYAYCLGKGMPEDTAARWIRAGRAAREHPTIFDRLADGRLHLSGVVMLAPHLTHDNAREPLAAACGKTKAEIERVLAEWFPLPDLVTSIEPIPVAPSPPTCPEHVCEGKVQPAPERVDPAPRDRVKPLGPERFAMQVTIDAETHKLLREVQALLGHTVPSGDVAGVLRESLRIAKQALEKRRFAETSKPRPGRRTRSARHVPAHVRREVWQRDQGRCTFVSDSGHRCESRTRLEFDHVTPVARGGEATIVNLRLRCRAHNQYEAERVFGERFMARKRQRTRDRGRASDGAAEGRGTTRAEPPVYPPVCSTAPFVRMTSW
jgi:hypothetical protein